MGTNKAFENDEHLAMPDHAPAKKEKPKPPEALKILGEDGIFQFATRKDKIYMIIGVICAIIHGSGYPVIFIFYGGMTDDFISYAQCETFTNILFNTTAQDDSWDACFADIETNLNDTNLHDPSDVNCDQDQITASISLYKCLNSTTFPVPEPWCTPLTPGTSCVPNSESVMKQIGRYAVIFVVIAIICLVAAVIQMVMFTWSSAAQARRIREEFFKSVVKQEISYFDENTVGQIQSKISEDISKIADGIGDKFCVLIQKIATFVIGFIVAYIIGWELAGVMTLIIPFIIVGGGVMGKFVGYMTDKELQAYAQAGSISQEVIDGIRVVTAFEGQNRETVRYDNSLQAAEKQGVKKGLVTGAFMGYIWLVVFIAFAASFYIGANVFFYPAGQLITVFFCILIGSMYLGQAAPNLSAVSIARVAAKPVYDLIKKESEINAFSDKGKKLSNVKGDIEFHNVTFAYPLKPDNNILKNMNLKCNASQITAICGPSGMGKSTLIQLILRYYDPQEGRITLDGHDLRDLNVRWLRGLMAYVEQEPAMLAGSVYDNIRFANPKATNDEIREAARQANCYCAQDDFISDLPQGFDTHLTSGGGGLSGGQKQRIAIARALVRGAQILLLDQATSALDVHSEKLVIKEINKRRKGRTTILIAQRLSTVRAADVINGIEHGAIKERGSHNELMKEEGIYYALVTLGGGDTGGSKDEKKSVKEEVDEETGLVRSASKRFRQSIRSKGSAMLRQAIPNAVAPIEDDDEPYDPLAAENYALAQMDTKGLGKRILSYNRPEFCLMAMGGIGAIINGAIMPMFSIVFSSLLQVLGMPAGDERNQGILIWSLAFLGIGVVSFFTQFMQAACFAKSGEKLTRRMRRISFHSILGQDITWFDSPMNSPAVLVGSLASDCAAVQGAAGASLGAIFQALAAIIVGLTIAFWFGWMLALVVLVFFPFIVLTGIIQGRIWSGSAGRDRGALETAGVAVMECCKNIRVVAAYGKEESFNDIYIKAVKQPYDAAIGSAFYNALMFALSQTIIFFAYGAAFGYGGYLVQTNVLAYYFVFRVFAAVIFGGQAVGRAMAFAPEYAKALNSAKQVFRIIDRVATYADPYSDEGRKITYEQSRGDIVLKNINFTYPSRPDTQVLHELNLHIPAGKTVAFVGQSGCGKSTSMQLIQRFYDPNEQATITVGKKQVSVVQSNSDCGKLIVDGVATIDANTKSLRRLIGIVAQDPILFDISIEDNIKYGIPEDLPVTHEQVVEAAKAASIHETILRQPQQYNTRVGPGGNRLARGEKQRICIARAIIRKPRILLLDEATSALDVEVEGIVTEALEKAAEGRTCMLIAHRLSTVRNADIIAVMNKGVVIEAGSHEELMAIGPSGAYYKLVNANVQLS